MDTLPTQTQKPREQRLERWRRLYAGATLAFAVIALLWFFWLVVIEPLSLAFFPPTPATDSIGSGQPD